MKEKLTTIANYLTTRNANKKHGGYNIYEDDKIYISYDTYHPNVDVYVFIEGKKHLAAIYSGHGYRQEFHPGEWCNYVKDVLYPKACVARETAREAALKLEEGRKKAKNARLPDESVFA